MLGFTMMNCNKSTKESEKKVLTEEDLANLTVEEEVSYNGNTTNETISTNEEPEPVKSGDIKFSAFTKYKDYSYTYEITRHYTLTSDGLVHIESSHLKYVTNYTANREEWESTSDGTWEEHSMKRGSGWVPYYEISLPRNDGKGNISRYITPDLDYIWYDYEFLKSHNTSDDYSDKLYDVVK